VLFIRKTLHKMSALGRQAVFAFRARAIVGILYILLPGGGDSPPEGKRKPASSSPALPPLGNFRSFSD
jgi:hypothetical protein